MKSWFFIILVVTFSQLQAQDGMPTALQVREAIAGEIAGFGISPAAIYKIENRKVWTGTDSVSIRIYYPGNGKNLPIVYNVHGGALVGGDLQTHENISIELANRTGSVVIALDYRKPPEFTYPASYTDCEAVLSWIKNNAATFNGDKTKLFITGDSGGGLQLAALAIKLKRELGARAICFINPATDIRTPSPGFYTMVVNWYLNGKPATDSIASPIMATDFNGMPPSLVIVSAKDELKPQGLALYDKLKNAATEVKLVELPAEDHLGGLWAANHPRAKQALDETVAFIIAHKK